MSAAPLKPFEIPLGFRGGATTAGLKKSGKPDLGLLVSEVPCTGAGIFTKNRFQGANLGVSREHLGAALPQAIVTHAGQANACTGDDGVRVARETCAHAAHLLDLAPEQILLGSTGVIGVLPDIGKLRSGMEAIVSHGLTAERLDDVASAMMTTDLVKKTAVAEIALERGGSIRLLGLAKGSGMIHPSMGTMLSYILTDARVPGEILDECLRRAADESFHCMTVDGDTSTSDLVFCLANGAANNLPIRHGSRDFDSFQKGLTGLCQSLARQVAQDGEGATHLFTINVKGASTREDAHRAAMAIGRSSLVKCAIFGSDPNWGRIACAVGYSGATFEPSRVSIRLGETLIFSAGQPRPFDRAALAAYLKENREVVVTVDLAAGAAACTVWSCDLTYDYVRINAEYTT